MRVLFPVGTSITQLLHLKLRDHHGRWDKKKTVRDREPGHISVG